MESVKYEDIQQIFDYTCETLIEFIRANDYTPLEKIFKNICIYITNSCVIHLPPVNLTKYSLQVDVEHLDKNSISIDENDGIFAIYYHHNYHQCVSSNNNLSKDLSNDSIWEISNQVDSQILVKEKTLRNSVSLANKLLRLFAITKSVSVEGAPQSIIYKESANEINQKNLLMDYIEGLIFNSIKQFGSNNKDKDHVNLSKLVNSMILFEHMYVTLDQLVHEQVLDVLGHICDKLLCSRLTLVRTLAGSVLARILFKQDPIFAIDFVHTHLINNFNDEDNNPKINNNAELYKKYGVAEFIFYVVNLVNENNINILALSFIVHVVKHLLDKNHQLSYCYSIMLAQLMKYIPLFVETATNFINEIENNKFIDKVENEKVIEPTLRVKIILMEQLQFMRELSMPSSNKPLELPFEITNVKLRPYQMDGINWLLFLQKYNLNGALCDDMGLGKTIQTIITVAYTHCINNKINAGAINIDCKDNIFELNESDSNINSTTLIICPPILIEHWFEEFEKYLPANLLKVTKIVKGKQLQQIFKSLAKNEVDVIITSYSHLKTNVDHFKKFSFNYIVLDEAHLIKNKNSKFYLTVKALKSKYRLILTGTPIQNNVTELWTLFDFLMPNFLGSHKLFNRTYARPIFKGFNPKCTSEAFLLGQKLLDQLHKQILPFLLRRTKQTVLDDLPEKIIQTIFCSMTPLQKSLYNIPLDRETDALMSQIKDISLDQNATPNPHIFKTIHYLRRVCNHPSLALQSIDDSNVQSTIESLIKNQPLHDVNVASKLVALMELLQECGIYNDASDEIDDELELVTDTSSLHRALIFSQSTTVLDIIENDLLKKHMPNVKYLRLDGTIPQADRYPITKQFNNDSNISLLLLTTSVGSIGLNLTGADMVIFYDIDWNPMKDLQAMDRAHRIGQTKIVNVYRLVLKDTIEEYILTLQDYKLKMVNTVINESNSDLNKMKESDISEVFGATKSSKLEPNDDAIAEDYSDNNKVVLSSIKRSHSKLNNANHKDFSNDEDYAKQYDLKKFCKNLK